MKVAAVVPTCRGFKVPEQSIPVDWIVVHDRQEWPVEGEAAHIVAPDPTMWGSRCSCVRSAGFLYAYRLGATHILTADDDCLLPIDWAADHVSALDSAVPCWNRTVSYFPLPLRGEPEGAAPLPVAISHGLWSNVPDLAGKTQLEWPHLRLHLPSKWERIHPPFTLSSMNFGFRREVTPAMYQPFMGDGWPFKRHDDIWLGVLAERVLQLHGYAFLNGGAIVWHSRASDPQRNAETEAAGVEEHEQFWKYVWQFEKKRAVLEATYWQMTEHIDNYEPVRPEHEAYFRALAVNMRRWLELLRA